MLGRALPICFLLVTLPLVSTRAEQGIPPASSTVHAPENTGAEKVFGRAASKVVFLITRKSGELRARASGIILTADGYIATNFHALAGADAVEIRFFPDPMDSENYQSFNGAKLFYADAERDIAILKVNATTLSFLECTVRAGCVPRVGEPVYAIGNPKGLSNTISEGIVSALRSAGGEDVIQHTAAISPGSSGGALLDSSGNLLGMNSWQVADGQNLNFAISARHLLEALAAARQTTTALSFPPEDPGVIGNRSEKGAAGQAVAAKDRAVSQMRRIVDAIRQCPEATTSDRVIIIHHRSPRILEWDVLASNSLRAPFQGYVWFSLPVDLQEGDEAKRSKQLHREYEFLVTVSSTPEQHRYEFDLGSDAPELRRALLNLQPSSSTDLKPYEPNSSCWDRIARSPRSVVATHGDSK